MRAAQLGMVVNIALTAVKFVSGVVGHSYALVADAAESGFDLFGSLAVWAGVRIADRDATDEYPFGFGKAEALSGALVAMLLLIASFGIAIASIHEIRTPHHAPAAWTLFVLGAVIVIKELMARRVRRVALAEGSTALAADAQHHRSDAITSLAAFAGIAVALLGGPGWESADDWAALVAAGVIAWNGIGLLRTAVADLMDRVADPAVVMTIRNAANAVDDVRAIEKLAVRRAGRGYWVDIHVQADPSMSLDAAHIVSGKVKGAIRSATPQVLGVLVHMEPHADAPVHSLARQA
ncbi:MAG TPA: cation diffusion facilitator family transporter [Gemmatimonadaceae bacterium]|nr:cation diffusion facilitator family transporter [Gemmatimonadaceae bacterium]